MGGRGGWVGKRVSSALSAFVSRLSESSVLLFFDFGGRIDMVGSSMGTRSGFPHWSPMRVLCVCGSSRRSTNGRDHPAKRRRREVVDFFLPFVRFFLKGEVITSESSVDNLWPERCWAKHLKDIERTRRKRTLERETPRVHG